MAMMVMVMMVMVVVVMMMVMVVVSRHSLLNDSLVRPEGFFSSNYLGIYNLKDCKSILILNDQQNDKEAKKLICI